MELRDFILDSNELTDCDPLLPRRPYRIVGNGLYLPPLDPAIDFVPPTDAMVKWAPQPGAQTTFLRDQSTHEILLHGNRGGGKSDCLLASFFQGIGQGLGESYIGLLIRREEKDLESLRARLRFFNREVFPEARITYSPHTEMRWPTGEKLILTHMAREQDYDSFHGWSIAWLGMDEITQHPTPSMYLQLLSTSRSSNPRITPIVRATCNPGGVGSSWVKKRFLDTESPDRKAVRLMLNENKMGDPNYLEKLQKACTDENQRKAWIEGRWDLASGMMFEMWDPEIHVIEDISFTQIANSGWVLGRSYDHGVASPWACLFFATSNGESLPGNVGPKRGDIILLDEIYGADGEGAGLYLDSHEIGKMIVRRQDEMGLKFRIGVADNQIFAGDASSPTNNPSKAFQRLGLYWEAANKSPGSRIAGWQQIRSLLKGSIPGPNGTRDQPGLFVCARAKETIRQLPLLTRDKKTLDDIDKDTKEDHIADAVRYFVLRSPRAAKSRSF
jgi:hypothetical protein